MPIFIHYTIQHLFFDLLLSVFQAIWSPRVVHEEECSSYYFESLITIILLLLKLQYDIFCLRSSHFDLKVNVFNWNWKHANSFIMDYILLLVDWRKTRLYLMLLCCKDVTTRINLGLGDNLRSLWWYRHWDRAILSGLIYFRLWLMLYFRLFGWNWRSKLLRWFLGLWSAATHE